MRINSSSTLMFALTVLATAGVPACGSSDKSGSNGNGSTFSSGLPPGTVAGSLTPSQQQQLCTSISDYAASSASSSKSAECKFAGLAAASVTAQFNTAATDADVQKACSGAVSTCENTKLQAFDAGASTCAVPPNCNATVGELEQCVNDSNSALQKEFSTIPDCSTVTKSSLSAKDAGLSVNPATPASCATAQQKCPGIATGSSASSSVTN
jgi:hypothetical protein